MLTIETQTPTGQWVKVTGREWRTMRGVRQWLDHTIDGTLLKARHRGRVRITGSEEPRARRTGMDPNGWVHAGDVFHHRWGYDMVINDYYEVVAVSPSGRTVTIRPIDTITLGSPLDAGGCLIRPRLTGDRFTGPTQRRRVHLSMVSGRPVCSIRMPVGCALLMEPDDYLHDQVEDHND